MLSSVYVTKPRENFSLIPAELHIYETVTVSRAEGRIVH